MARRRRKAWRRPREAGALPTESASAGEGGSREDGSRGDESRKAERYALDLLALRPRTVRELTTRLRSRGYDERVVADIVERCSRAGYVDDRKFAEYWIEERCRSYPCGPARMRMELRRKGVGPETLALALAEQMPFEREAELAVRVALRKARTLKEQRRQDNGAETAAKQRLWSFLRRRGFGTRACLQAMKAVWGPAEELTDLELSGDDAADMEDSGEDLEDSSSQVKGRSVTRTLQLDN